MQILQERKVIMMFFRKKIWWIILSTIIVVFLFAGNNYLKDKYKKHPNIFLIPNGFVGWIEIHYGLNGYPPLPTEGEAIILRIPESGILKTSSEPSYTLEKFYYVDKNDNRIELGFEFEHGGTIGSSELIRSDGSTTKYPIIERHFIGTNEQWEQWLDKDK